MKEEWRDVVGYEGLYQVSTLGRVKSLEKRLRIKSGNYRIKLETIKRQHVANNGYLTVGLSDSGKNRNVLVHRLIAEAFIENSGNLETVNHINGIKTDNNVHNLEWCSHRDNLLHALENGLRKPRKKKLDDIQALTTITHLSAKNRTMADISRHFNVSEALIARIKNGETFKNIPPLSTIRAYIESRNIPEWV
jgi:hypothetical protein